MKILLRHAAFISLALSAVLIFAACDDTGEQVPTDSPTADATMTPGGGTATAAPSGTATPRPTAPADWPEYTSADGKISLRYPSDWYESGAQFTSYDPSTITDSPGVPPEGLEVEAHAYEAAGLSVCGGVFNLDESGAAESVHHDAVETTLGGQPAWELVRDNFNDIPRIHEISLLYKGNCIGIVAYYTQETPDEQTFAKIAESFTIDF